MKSLFTSILLTLSATTFAQIPSYVPSNGLVGWWPFNGNANDESGNGNTSNLLTGYSFNQDRFGNTNSSFFLDGVDGTNKGCDIVFPNALVNFSISIWFKIEDTIKIGQNPAQTIFNFSPFNTIGTSFNHPYFPANMGGCLGDGLDWQICGVNNQIQWTLDNKLSWHNLTVCFDGLTIQYFLDGLLVDEQTINFSLPSLTAVNIGHIPVSSGEVFSGSLDDIGIWNRALTACEIKDLYNSQLGSQNTYSSQSQTAIDSYTWPVNGQTYTQSGVYVDTLVNATGCDSIVTLNLELDFTGIESNTPTTFKLYPNPVKDELFIKGMHEAVLPFEVYSTDSKKVLSGTTSGTIDVNALKKGSYLLKMKEQTIPFVKQ
jgi:hypothetical protein